MTEYHVVWRIEVDAVNADEAAMQARMLLLDPKSEAVNFEVTEFYNWQRYGDLAEFTPVDLSDVDFTVLDRP